ncbi:hypothetical protein B0H19DRAFT_1262199 [Mycena capillaripes]|nr:hypothetical protein B0H19DRAFT_1262199 [Mycena capillaripes]
MEPQRQSAAASLPTVYTLRSAQLLTRSTCRRCASPYRATYAATNCGAPSPYTRHHADTGFICVESGNIHRETLTARLQRNPSPQRPPFTVSRDAHHQPHAQCLRRPSLVADTTLTGSSPNTSISVHPQPNIAPPIVHVAFQHAANIFSAIPLRRSRLHMPHIANHDALHQRRTQHPLRPFPSSQIAYLASLRCATFSAGFRPYTLDTADALLSATRSARARRRHSRRHGFCPHTRHDHWLRYPSSIHDQLRRLFFVAISLPATTLLGAGPSPARSAVACASIAEMSTSQRSRRRVAPRLHQHVLGDACAKLKAGIVNGARVRSRRVTAFGTTSTLTLSAVADLEGAAEATDDACETRDAHHCRDFKGGPHSASVSPSTSFGTATVHAHRCRCVLQEIFSRWCLHLVSFWTNVYWAVDMCHFWDKTEVSPKRK